MLFDYQKRTQLLLHDPKIERFNIFDLASYINTARRQVAGEGECVRNYATLPVGPPAQQYPFSSIVLGTPATGILEVLNIRMATWQVAMGAKRMTTRAWEFFNEYVLNNPVPVAGPPAIWAQYGQGALGSIFINLPDTTYTLNLDTVCLPIPLALDTDPEAIPFPWTDAVPYYAAYVALLTAGNMDGAQGMFQQYTMFANRARQFSTPSVVPHQYLQGPDIVLPNRLGVHPAQQRNQPTTGPMPMAG
jgi:hypothetical protein